jgi:hypothetical protein
VYPWGSTREDETRVCDVVVCDLGMNGVVMCDLGMYVRH